MIGRNDPCLCGSGKKYKKCCAHKNEVSVQELVKDELNLMIGNYFKQDLSYADRVEFERYKKEWEKLLGKRWEHDKLLGLISEYFIFVARRDRWKQYLIKVLNGPIRNSVRSVMEQWRDPIVLVGKVIEHAGNSIIVEEILGSERYQMEIVDDMVVSKGTVILGIVLRDNRRWDNGVLEITGFLTIENERRIFENDFIALAESSGIENRTDFYKTHLVDVYQLLTKRREGSEIAEVVVEVDEEMNDELTEVQRRAVSILETHIETAAILPEEQEALKKILTMYLLEEQPNFRKPEILAAATVQAAMENELLTTVTYTQAEIAKMFDVSVASMKKQSDPLKEFVLEMNLVLQK